MKAHDACLDSAVANPTSSPYPGAAPQPVILADTSVWIDHLRSSNSALQGLLEQGRVLTHPFVIGELACGNLNNRAELLKLLKSLPKANVATDEEALSFIGVHDLAASGIGYVDVHLLASATLASVSLWTLDKRLTAATQRLGLNP